MKAGTTLLTQPNYLAGVRVLQRSLQMAGSQYPLIVMVTQNIDPKIRRTLESSACLLRDIDPLAPSPDRTPRYAASRFSETWTKLRVWDLERLERVVLLDADMLVLQNMDELFDVELPSGWIAASHACRCNPHRVSSYPAHGTPSNCHYTHVHRARTSPNDAERRRTTQNAQATSIPVSLYSHLMQTPMQHLMRGSCQLRTCRRCRSRIKTF
jgi:alpha-N-acetylglucosamine transferase